jgi:hypothetical protein
MALKDIFNKKYTSNCWCNNCQTHQEVQIPKGVSITQFIESATGKCNNCGCNSLVADYKQIDEYKEQQPKPQVKLLRTGRRLEEEPKRASVPPQRPSNRPVDSFPKPKPLPINPDFTPRGIVRGNIDDMDFWLGKSKKGDNY